MNSPILQVLFAAGPILLLIVLMTKPKAMPSYRALPLMAALVWVLALVWFGREPGAVNAAVFSGLFTALTPILIMAGALFLFRAMEVTGALGTITGWLQSLTQNRVALAMIVGWAFSFLLEGASGFGTPIALAAPILVGLGFNPLKVAVMCLIMNSVPVTFGAVGTPVWFGLSRIPGLEEAQILEIGLRSALLHGAASLVIPVVGMLVLMPWKELRRSLGFVYLSVGITVLPYLAMAFFGYEFPSLVGGLVGLVGSALFARLGWGLPRDPAPIAASAASGAADSPGSTAANPPAAPRRYRASEVLKAGFPLWGTTLFLVVTRLPWLPFKDLLSLAQPAWQLPLGSLGELSLSPSLVVGLDGLMGTGVHLSHKLLYVPSLLPFGLIALVALFWYRTPPATWAAVGRDTLERIAKPSQALFGALVFVEIMMLGGESSAVSLVGSALAAVFGGAWQFFASFLGALGAFFSGSNTVSNLTFGGIQDSMASRLGLDRVTILALQSTGGAYGHMIAIGPVISAATMLGLKNQEGAIIRGAFPALVLYGLIVGAVSYLF